jgi:hypothetical protein
MLDFAGRDAASQAFAVQVQRGAALCKYNGAAAPRLVAPIDCPFETPLERERVRRFYWAPLTFTH